MRQVIVSEDALVCADGGRVGGEFEIVEEEVALDGGAAHHAPQRYRVFRGHARTLGAFMRQRCAQYRESVFLQYEVCPAPVSRDFSQ